MYGIMGLPNEKGCVMEYKIYEGNIERIDKKMEKYQRKFDKIGATLVYEKVGEEFVDFGNEYQRDVRRFVVVRVEGLARLNGWKIVGKVERTTTNENSMTCYIASETAFSIMLKYKNAEIVCEHCNTRAKRKYGYILENEGSGEVKMVGSSCLSSFVGIDATAYASLLALFDSLAEFEEIPANTAVKKYYRTDLILQVAYQLIDKYGYTSRTGYVDEFYAEENPEATVFAVRDIVVGRKPHERYEAFTFIENDQQTVQKAQSLKEFFKEFVPTTNYETNLLLALESEYTTVKNIGILTASIKTKEIKEQEMKRLEELTSVWVGQAGDKIELANCGFSLISSYETQFGRTYIYKILCDGNTFVWKTSKEVENGKYNIKATVKGHNEFRNEKQTELTRVKII